MMNEDLSNFIYINKLLDAYKELLSHSQKEIMVLYYEFNLSLSEIAEEKNISRSAVNDAIKKGLKSLEEYEEKLHMVKNKDELIQLSNKIDKEEDINEIKKQIKEFIKDKE